MTMSNNGGGVPMLGTEKPKVGVQYIVSFIRSLDENGQYEPESITMTGPQTAIAHAGRHNILSAEDLIDEVAAEVVERLTPAIRQLLAESKLDKP